MTNKEEIEYLESKLGEISYGHPAQHTGTNRTGKIVNAPFRGEVRNSANDAVKSKELRAGDHLCLGLSNFLESQGMPCVTEMLDDCSKQPWPEQISMMNTLLPAIVKADWNSEYDYSLFNDCMTNAPDLTAAYIHNVRKYYRKKHTEPVAFILMCFAGSWYVPDDELHDLISDHFSHQFEKTTVASKRKDLKRLIDRNIKTRGEYTHDMLQAIRHNRSRVK